MIPDFLNGQIKERLREHSKLILSDSVIAVQIKNAFFQPKSIDIFLTSPQKHILWNVIWSTSYVFIEKRKKKHLSICLDEWVSD